MKILFTASVFITALLSQAQVTTGLVAKYSFNTGSAIDEVGNNNGTASGAILTPDRFGNPNKAYKFTNGEYITLPNVPALKSAIPYAPSSKAVIALVDRQVACTIVW